MIKPVFYHGNGKSAEENAAEVGYITGRHMSSFESAMQKVLFDAALSVARAGTVAIESKAQLLENQNKALEQRIIYLERQLNEKGGRE